MGAAMLPSPCQPALDPDWPRPRHAAVGRGANAIADNAHLRRGLQRRAVGSAINNVARREALRAEHLMRLEHAQADSRAKKAVMRGAELPPALEAHIAHELARSAPATREQVARHMDDIARELGICMAADPQPADEEETTSDPEGVRRAA